jgi:8-oxo-dGTP pyrophosphatase MutT (NUDIX family)
LRREWFNEAMPERTLGSSHPWRGHVVRVRVDEVERADGRRTTRDVVEHPGAVAILAWDGRRLAMVRQWRHAVGSELLELPAGTLEPDEPPAVTAHRELAEETGLAAGSWTEGPRFYTAPGFCNELMHLYLATELSDAGAEHGHDEDEDLTVEWLDLADALAAIHDGRIMDAKTIAGVEWLARRLPSSSPSR